MQRQKKWSNIRRSVRSDGGFAFFPDPGEGPAVAPDALAEELAEEFLASALTGQEQAPDSYDQVVEEESGGPFVYSSERIEFSRSSESDDDYEAEAFPTPSSSDAVQLQDSLDEDDFDY